VKDSKYSTLLETSKPYFYTPLRQTTGGQSFFVRTGLGPEKIAAALAREIKSIDQNLAAGEVITMREQVDRRSWSQRSAVTLLAIFSAIAVWLAGIGLYGVMSYAVSQSTRELGLRMALGAGASDLLRIVMSRGLGLTIGGIAVGTAVALGVTRLMGDLLYKVSPRDPIAFVSAFVVMTIAALAACFLPAWRATRTDPVRALRD
jgi:ABC-type antimicrobial peptide transport system permease subunit